MGVKGGCDISLPLNQSKGGRRIQDRLYDSLVTPFGLTGAPATFQRYINAVLRDHLDEDCSAYLDDVVIFSNRSRVEHRNLVKKIVWRLGEAELQLDLKKSEFEAESVRYLGFIVDVGRGIRMDPKKVKALRV